jgi:hypothetical protein
MFIFALSREIFSRHQTISYSLKLSPYIRISTHPQFLISHEFNVSIQSGKGEGKAVPVLLFFLTEHYTMRIGGVEL